MPSDRRGERVLGVGELVRARTAEVESCRELAVEHLLDLAHQLLHERWRVCAAADGVNGAAVWVKYSAEGANTIVANGSIVTNAVFDRGVSAMFNSTISDYDKADILAFHIPAVSSPAGKVAVFGNNDAVDMNVSCKVNHWGREGVQVENEAGKLVTVYPWLHSDIKNMAYYHVYPAFTNLIQKGDLK